MTFPETIPGIIFGQLDQTPDRVLYYHKVAGQWRPRTQRDGFVEAERVGMGLIALGVRRGDRVGILAQTRPEWLSCDGAILCIGAATVGIYPSSLPVDVAYILNHSETRVLIVENLTQLQKLQASPEPLPFLKTVLLIDGEPPPAESLPFRVMTLNALMSLGAEEVARGPAGRYRAMGLEVTPDEMATLIYTSGTTGPPKGAVLTHGNFYRIIRAVKSAFDFRPDEVSLVYLPLAHSLQRFTVYQGLETAITGYFAESLDKVQQNFEEVRPTIISVVPRILEKVYTKVQSTVAAAPPLRQRIFHWALGIGKRYHDARARGEEPLLPLRVAYGIADRLVFNKIRARLGGRVDRIVSGGAPLSPVISEFFFAMGILVIEGYGLTETCAPATINTPTAYRFGTVGRALPGVDLKIAEDGEVLIRGPGVFKEYYKDAAATDAALQDGWFHSGDIGTLDDDGYLRITDRKKDLIITSAGKNVAPQNIENQLKNAPLVAHAMVYGDKRNYLTALITVDEAEVRAFLESPDRPMTELITDSRLTATLDQAVQRLNESLPSFERIKKFAVLPVDFSVEGGELTPTLKLKRRVVAQRYKAILDGFYAEKFE